MLGFADEVWWSRLAQPDLHAWSDQTPLRLQEMTLPKEDKEQKAVACYGILRADIKQVLVRFVDGRPVSHVTIAFLIWVCEQLALEGKKEGAAACVGQRQLAHQQGGPFVGSRS